MVYLSVLCVSIDSWLYLQRLGVTCGSIAARLSVDWVVFAETQGDV